MRDLNAVGFVLTANEPPFAFARVALGSEVHLRLEPVVNDLWRIRLSVREPVKRGKIANPLVPVSLTKLGATIDGALELDTKALITNLRRLLETCVLPTIDLAPG